MFEDISVLFVVDQAHDFKYTFLDYHKTVNKDHGRIEVRECWSTSNPEYLKLIRGVQNWAGLRNITMVVSTRIINGKESKVVCFYISSMESDAKRILHIVRKHWSIENKLHWVLDVALNEDHSRVRKDQAPQNLAVLRHIALNLLTCAEGKVQASKRKPPKGGSSQTVAGCLESRLSPQSPRRRNLRCDCPSVGLCHISLYSKKFGF